MNQEQAERCIDIGRQALRQGDYEKALRMFQKSYQMFPTTEADCLIHTVTQRLNNNSRQEEQKKQQQEANKPVYTQEQQQLALKISQMSDFYQILGVNKNANDDEIKRAYRKLALRLHPDKNQAPAAQDAFKKVGRAYSCLSNQEKRRIYDQTGSDETQQTQNYEFNDDLAEELFRSFFGGSFSFHNGGFYQMYGSRGFGNQRHRQQQRSEMPQGQRNFWQLVQFLPLIILLLFSSFGAFTSQQPMYSFHPTPRYNTLKHTINSGIPYWLEASVARELTPPEYKDLESMVERSYISNLRAECNMVKQKKQNLLNKANWSFGNQGRVYREQAEKIDMKSCVSLQELLGY